MQTTHSILVFCLDVKSKEALESFLKPLRVELLTAYGQNDFLKKAVEAQVDLIVVDVDSLGGDGFKAIQNLKKNPQTKHIPFFLITHQESDRQRAIDAGCADVLLKPLEKNAVQTKVEVALNVESSQRFLEEKTKLESILDVLDDGVVVLTPDLQIAELNEKAKDLLDWPNPSLGKAFVQRFLKIYTPPPGVLIEKEFSHRDLDFQVQTAASGALPASTLRVRTRIVKNIFSQISAIVVVLCEK